MLRRIISSVAVIALMGGAAVAQQSVPPATGLTPGAPLGSDPYTDEGLVVGEAAAIERRAAQMPMGRAIFDPRRTFGLTGSPSGLTPGVPTGSDPFTDSKQVVGGR